MHAGALILYLLCPACRDKTKATVKWSNPHQLWLRKLCLKLAFIYEQQSALIFYCSLFQPIKKKSSVCGFWRKSHDFQVDRLEFGFG